VGVILGAVGLAAIALPAEAQVGPPIRLTPPPQAAPPIGAPPQTPGTGATSAPRAPERVDPSHIDVGQPAPLDLDAVGLIDAAHGGLEPTIWDGSERAAIDRLLAALPVPMKSSAARTLTRRVLVTIAASPRDGARPSADKSLAGSTFAGLRAERLLAMGDIRGAVDLARAIPTRDLDANAARVLLDAHLLANETDAACALTRGQVGRLSDVYWQKSQIFCLALAGERARAELGLNLLREQNAEDPTFVRLLLAIGTTTRERIAHSGELTPLRLAMLRAARQPIPPDIVKPDTVRQATASVLAAIAQNEDAPLDARLVAAEHAVMLGALPADWLAQLYDKVVFNPGQIANAVSFAESDRGPRGRAVLHRVAKQQTIVVARAQALQKMWAVARDAGVYPAAVRASLPLLRAITPASEVAWFAGDAARGLLLAGDRDGARTWFNFVLSQRAPVPETATTADLLWPLMRFAGDDASGPADPARLEAWRRAIEKRPREVAERQRAMLAVLLSALDERQDAGTVLGPAAEIKARWVEMPDLAIWIALGAPDATDRVGETALLALVALGEDGVAGGNPYVEGAAIAALHRVGLEADARALALEAAIAAGL